MRAGLVALIGGEPDFQVVGEAADRRATLEKAAALQPEVIVLDLMLQQEDGLTLIRELGAQAPAARVVVFSMQPEAIFAERSLRAGARAYVMKDAPVVQLYQAIREVLAGRIAVSPAMTAAALEALRGNAPRPAAALSNLTDRELQVFRLCGLGLPTREAAERLGVSVKTVEAHRENIKNKLGLATHAELVARAARWLEETARGPVPLAE